MPMPLHKGLLITLLLALALGIGAYGRALDGPLFFDDVPNITQNALLAIDGQDYDAWRAASLSSNAGPLRRPVSMASLAANHAAQGAFDPAGLKAVNLALHVLSAILIYNWCSLLLRAPALKEAFDDQSGRLVALVAAAIWLLQPLHVSTVLYVVQRMAQLSTLFVLAGLLVFTRYRLRWSRSGAGTGEVIAAAMWLAMLTAGAAFSKENGALLPWLVLVVEVALFRGYWNGRAVRPLALAAWALLLLPLLALLAVLWLSPETLLAGYDHREFTFQERILTQLRFLWIYVGWLLVPDITSMGFQHDDLAWSTGLTQPYTTILALLAWAAALIAAFLLRRRFPLLLFAVFFYLVAHSMESGILPLEMIYEHRNYLPSVAICVAVAATFWKISLFCNRLNFGAMAGSYLAILALLLAIRATIWSDESALFRFNVVNHPESPRAHFLYGHALLKQFQELPQTDTDSQEAKGLMVTARHMFSEMYRLDRRDIASMSMLYQIDAAHFSSMPERKDWLRAIEVSLSDRPLQASDLSSIMSLVSFMKESGNDVDKDRLDHILDSLIARYPDRAELRMQKFSLVSSIGHYSAEERRSIVSVAQQVSPNSLEVYAYLVLTGREAEDAAALYEAARGWLEADRLRRELPAIKSVL